MARKSNNAHGAARDTRGGAASRGSYGKGGYGAGYGSGKSAKAAGPKPLRGGAKRQQQTVESWNKKDSDRGAKKTYNKGKGRTQQKSGSSSDYIEGRRAVAEALELGIPVQRALIQKDAGTADTALTDLEKQLKAAGIEVERVAKQILDSLSSHGAHQGVMLKVSPYEYAELADIIERAGEGGALVIVLDHVTDEGNFGAICRTAEIVGAAGVVIAKARAARVGVGAYKTSAGAVMHLPIAQVSNLATALDELKQDGFWAGAATEHASDLVWDAPLAGRVALVMGSEGNGISRLVREHCDFEFKLPQRGNIESLNVAQATTAISYEWLRREMS